MKILFETVKVQNLKRYNGFVWMSQDHPWYVKADTINPSSIDDCLGVDINYCANKQFKGEEYLVIGFKTLPLDAERSIKKHFNNNGYEYCTILLHKILGKIINAARQPVLVEPISTTI